MKGKKMSKKTKSYMERQDQELNREYIQPATGEFIDENTKNLKIVLDMGTLLDPMDKPNIVNPMNPDFYNRGIESLISGMLRNVYYNLKYNSGQIKWAEGAQTARKEALSRNVGDEDFLSEDPVYVDAGQKLKHFENKVIELKNMAAEFAQVYVAIFGKQPMSFDEYLEENPNTSSKKPATKAATKEEIAAHYKQLAQR